MKRPARIVIGVLGLDQHEVAAISVARLLTRNGFEVIYLGRFQTPSSLVVAAESEDADLVGVSCHSWEFTAYVDELVERCRDAGVACVFGGSVLTEADIDDLRSRGIHAAFGPGYPEDLIVSELQSLVEQVRTERLPQ